MTNIIEKIPQEYRKCLLQIEKQLVKYGFSVRIVGGFVRDVLSNRENNSPDIDLSTTANPSELKEIFKNDDIFFIKDVGGQIYGTSIIINKNSGMSFEITSARRDIQTFGRSAKVEFTRSFKEDSDRRDFTINALYLDLQGNIEDFHNGVSDLSNKIVRFIGEPRERIEEDYLRIIRYFRFCGLFGKFDEKIMQLCQELSHNLRQISMQRITSEMVKTITKNSVKSLEYIDKFGIFKAIGLQINFELFNKVCTVANKTLETTGIPAYEIKLIALLSSAENIDIIKNSLSKKTLTLLKISLENPIDYGNLPKLFAKYQNIEKCIQKIIFFSKNPANDLQVLTKLSQLQKPKIDINGLQGAEISYTISSKLEEFYTAYLLTEGLQNN